MTEHVKCGTRHLVRNFILWKVIGTLFMPLPLIIHMGMYFSAKLHRTTSYTPVYIVMVNTFDIGKRAMCMISGRSFPPLVMCRSVR